MILHIAQDEKFIDAAIANFELAAPSQNFLCVVTDRNDLRYIRRAKVDLVVGPSETKSKDLLRELRRADFVVLYATTWPGVNVAWRAACPVIWIGFGYDYYPLIYGSIDALLLEQTRALRERIQQNTVCKRISASEHIARTLKHWTKRLLYSAGLRSYYTDRHMLAQLIEAQKITHFSPRLPREYELVRRSIKTSTFPKYIAFTFETVTPHKDPGLFTMSTNGNNVLLGHSASYTNNHIEAMELLAQHADLNDRKVIVPLSYGNMTYASEIMKVGKELLGSSFFPITEFMSRRDYYSLLSTCSVAVMNHKRQEALGNISMSLFLGAKVFLRAENVAYTHYRDQGYVVHEMSQLADGSCQAFTALPDEDRQRNRQLRLRQALKGSALDVVKQLIEEVRRYS